MLFPLLDWRVGGAGGEAHQQDHRLGQRSHLAEGAQFEELWFGVCGGKWGREGEMPLPVIPQDAFCKNKKASTPTQKRIQLCSTQYNDLIVLVPVDGRHHGGSLKFCHSRDHHQNNIKALFINLKTVVSEKRKSCSANLNLNIKWMSAQCIARVCPPFSALRAWATTRNTPAAAAAAACND